IAISPDGHNIYTTNNGANTISQYARAAVESPPPPPTETAGAAASIAESAARLTGTVNPNGLTTTYHFEYGTSTAYGSKAPATEASAGSASPPQPVSVPLTGLLAGTTYHYRLTATNASGTTAGTDQAFTTTTAPGPLGLNAWSVP